MSHFMLFRKIFFFLTLTQALKKGRKGMPENTTGDQKGYLLNHWECFSVTSVS